jgi:hypothetical protein
MFLESSSLGLDLSQIPKIGGDKAPPSKGPLNWLESLEGDASPSPRISGFRLTRIAKFRRLTQAPYKTRNSKLKTKI